MESRFERQLKKGAAGDAGTGAGVCGTYLWLRAAGQHGPAQQRAFCAEGRHVVSHFVPAGRRWAYRSAMAYQPGPHRTEKILHGHAEGHAAYAVQRKAWRAFADCVDGFDREEQL